MSKGKKWKSTNKQMRRYQRKDYMNSKVGGSKGSFKYFRHKKWLNLIEGKLGMSKLVST